MPFNLIKTYNSHLELLHLNGPQRKTSLMGIFNRDIVNNPSFKFRAKQIVPTPKDGQDKMEILFTHLTEAIVDKKTRKREYDNERACRLHWLRFHTEEIKKANMLVFSIDEPEGIRTYVYDIDEYYVIILEPLRNGNDYYLITAYYLSGKDRKRDKIIKKHKRKLDEIY
jgi:hypothetical protein